MKLCAVFAAIRKKSGNYTHQRLFGNSFSLQKLKILCENCEKQGSIAKATLTSFEQFATKIWNLQQKIGSSKRLPKHFFALAFTFLLCGLFYWLSYTNPTQYFLAQAKESQNKIGEVIFCKDPLPQASLSNPSFEIYKIEVLCEKPQKKALEIEPESQEDPKITELREDLEPILTGTPMQQMIEPIAHQDRVVAAFLVGIAFKESKFGVYSPKNADTDCYNYWGFKGKTSPVMGGYSCFSTPKEAVEKVGARLEKLTKERGLNTPAQLTSWKCGSSCATHSPESVAKWISDVSIHFFKINIPRKTALES
ncbi:MAG: hypothetical protein U9O20_02940 [Patescibacteria group bacterium]|nr:hypothetical protein [Patescibacteria group bacterium]